MDRVRMLRVVDRVLEEKTTMSPSFRSALTVKIVDDLLAESVEAYDGPKARKTDPHTSLNAANLIAAKGGTHRVLLLEVFGRPGVAMTDEEAAERCGLTHAEYATRCSELRRMGLIEDTGSTRESSTGQARMLSIITQAGRDVLLARALRGSS